MFDKPSDIEGCIAVTRGGLLVISMEINDEVIEWEIKVKDNHYLISLTDAPSWVKVSDVIEAKVEAIGLLREHFGLSFISLEHVRQLIEEAWQEPCIVQRQIQEMVANAESR